MFERNGGNSEVAKAIEAVVGGDPNVALPILKKTVDALAGEPLCRCKPISPSLMQVQQPLARRSDPQAALAVPHKLVGPELAGREGICLAFYRQPVA